LAGRPFVEIAERSKVTVDRILAIHAIAQTFVLQTLVEQGVALLAKLLESQGRILAPAILLFPEYLRFGVPTEAARVLAAEGLRHRQAAVALGTGLIED
jgi:helicase